jgi:glycosyltransferase involved in cell wall biosynthesis
MLVNWRVRTSDVDLPDEQPSNKAIAGRRYWFFRHWEEKDLSVDVVDFTRVAGIHVVERRVLKFYVTQPLRVFPDLDGYDLIISHSAQSAVLLGMLRSLAGRKRPPHVVIDPGSFNGGRANPAELLPIRMSLTSVAGVIGHSRSQVPFYRDVLSLSHNRFRIVRVGVDTSFYSPIADQSDDGYVLCLGYMKRDWNTLLRAWQGLNTDAQLLILGREGIGEGVRGVSSMPYVHRTKLKEVVSRARFVVIPLPYFTYSFGQMTMLISQAMGKAVIATEVPGLMDYAENGRTAVFVRPYDAKDLRENIASLLDDPARARQMGSDARELVLSRFTERHMGLSLKEAVDELCENV